MAENQRTDDQRPAELIAPLKVMRLFSALVEGLGELNAVGPVDDPTRRRLIADHRAVVVEVASALSDPLIDEMVSLHIGPLDQTASLAELKLAEAQLLGWVTGLVVPGLRVAGTAPGD